MTMLYFAPDHTDSSQYVQYFGLVDDSQWATCGQGAGRLRRRTTCCPRRSPPRTASPAQVYTSRRQKMIDDQIIIPIVNPDLFLASRSDIQGMHYSACCNLDLAPAEQELRGTVALSPLPPSPRSRCRSCCSDHLGDLRRLATDARRPVGVDRR